MSVLINDPVQGRIFTEIIDELVRSKVKHPSYPDSELRRTAITLEELLEAIHELTTCAMRLQNLALHVERIGNEEKFLTMEDLRKELIHTGAMVVKQLEKIYTREAE